MRLVQMIMTPLIFTSIITGIIGNTSENFKNFGLRLLLCFVFTTTIAITTGLIVTLILKPGQYIFELRGFPNSGKPQIVSEEQADIVGNIPNAISNFIPNNPMESILTAEMLGVVIFIIIIGVVITQLRQKKADKKLGVSSNISDFVIPVGATINMDSTALFQCVTTLLMAQAYRIELYIVNLLLITFTVVAKPAIPGGGVLLFSQPFYKAQVPQLMD